MRDFAADLGARRFDVRLRLVGGDPPSTLLRLVFELDRLLVGRRRAAPPETVAADEIAPLADAEFRPDVVVDLTGDPTAADPAVPTFAVAFGGAPGETALFAVLTHGGGVVAEIYDVVTDEVVERARPSLERADGLVSSAASVAARAAGLIVVRLVALREGRIRRRLVGVRLDRTAVGALSLCRHPEAFARALARHVYHLVCRAPHWRIGWRHVDGPGLAETGDFDGVPFQPLPDPGLRCFADPFPVHWRGETHVLFEDFDHRLGQGTISAVRFDEGGPVGPVRPVLAEPWHLSFPFPIFDEGNFYLVPESTARREVTLYRCLAFPDRWEPVATLLSDVCASDVAIIRRGDRWWMFSTIEDGRGGWSDMLAIHTAPALLGPWTAHRDVPLAVDAGATRSAGMPFERDGRLFRPVQDCSVVYGGGVALVEVTRLDDEGYEQSVRRRIRRDRSWPGGRMHTLNRLGRLELIDGVTVRPRWDILHRLVEPLFEPGGRR